MMFMYFKGINYELTYSFYPPIIEGLCYDNQISYSNDIRLTPSFVFPLGNGLFYDNPLNNL